MLNETKTEIIEYKKGSDLRNIKKVRTIFDEATELSRRKQLATGCRRSGRKISGRKRSGRKRSGRNGKEKWI